MRARGTIVAAVERACVVLALAGAVGCGCGPTTPSEEVRNLLKTSGSIGAREVRTFTVPSPDIANIYLFSLWWTEQDATLNLELSPIGCRCGSCLPLGSTVGSNSIRDEADASCADGYAIRVVGDANRQADFYLQVDYRTAICES